MLSFFLVQCRHRRRRGDGELNVRDYVCFQYRVFFFCLFVVSLIDLIKVNQLEKKTLSHGHKTNMSLLFILWKLCHLFLEVDVIYIVKFLLYTD